MLMLGRRPSCVGRRTSAPYASGHTATLAAAAALNDMILALHRRSGANPPVVSPYTLLANLGSAFAAFWGLATAGQTAVVGDGSENVDRITAVAYLGSRRVIANIAIDNTGTTSAAPVWPSLPLLDPGRSWVGGLLAVGTQSVTLNSVSGGAPHGGNAAIVQSGQYVHLIDSGAPVRAWAGVAGVLSASAAWRTLSAEIVSA